MEERIHVNTKRLENEFQSLLQEGKPIGEVVRVLHFKRGFGLLLIMDAVMTTQKMSKNDAMQLVVRETSTNSGS